LGTAEQTPTAPETLQAWQASVQALLQQTPWAQYCLPSIVYTHSLAALQEAPMGFSPHEPLTQVFGLTHWAFCEQTS